MTFCEAKWTTVGGVLLAALAMGGTGCGEAPAETASTPPRPLNNGNLNTYRLKGLIDFSDDYNDRTSDLSGVHCSGLLLNETSMLTTARCARRLMRPGLSHDKTRGLLPDVYEWFEDSTRPPAYYKHCAWDAKDPCNLAGNKLTGSEEDPDGKIEKLSLYSLVASPDKDLAIITRVYYPNQAHENDFADIYMDDFTPATMPRLQLYGWGRVPGNSTYPLPQPRTGTMQVAAVTPSRIDLRPDQVQACRGDEGGAWTIPDTNAGSAYEVVALESSYTPDPNTGCSQSGSLDHATRLRDKMPWIESVIGPCGTSTDAGGHSIKRCYSLACDGAPDYETGAWDGCRGSGCSVCSDVIDAYPHYFEHHRNCSRNTTCGGYHYRCSSNCPAPTDADR